MTRARSDELVTKRDIALTLVASGSGRVLAIAAVVLIGARIGLGGPFGRADLIAPLATIAMTGTVEWIIHRYLLHAPLDSWTTRRLGTGLGHHQHHLDPPAIEFLMLRGIDAGVFITAFGLVTAAWSLPLMWITGASLVGGFLTAWACAALGLLHYEMVHLMVHTRYRPRLPYYRSLTRRHRLHHFRNEHYWLGVTSNTGDRIFRTLPKEKSDVPLSDTARTLGVG